MTIKERLNCLEELLDIEENTLSEDTILDELGEWDSMAAIALIAMFDEEFDKTITTSDVKGFKTVKDIMDKME